MATKLTMKKGFRVLKLSEKEASALGWGAPVEGCVCDMCNGLIEGDNIYYMGALGDTYHKDCMDEFIDKNDYYEEDADYEKEKIDMVVEHLKFLSFPVTE
jgi:hypothetical protein